MLAWFKSKQDHLVHSFIHTTMFQKVSPLSLLRQYVTAKSLMMVCRKFLKQRPMNWADIAYKLATFYSRGVALKPRAILDTLEKRKQGSSVVLERYYCG